MRKSATRQTSSGEKIKLRLSVWELMQSTLRWDIWGNEKVTQIYI